MTGDETARDWIGAPTLNGDRVILAPLTVDDAANAERVFEMLMGNDVAPRKEFIVEGAYALEADRIDA